MTMMVSLLRTNSLRSTCWPSFLAVFSTDETICIAILLGMLVRSRAEVMSRLAIGSLGSSTVMKSDLLSLFSWMLNSSSLLSLIGEDSPKLSFWSSERMSWLVMVDDEAELSFLFSWAAFFLLNSSSNLPMVIFLSPLWSWRNFKSSDFLPTRLHRVLSSESIFSRLGWAMSNSLLRSSLNLLLYSRPFLCFLFLFLCWNW